MPREKDGLNLAENIEIGSFFLEQPARKLYHHIAVWAVFLYISYWSNAEFAVLVILKILDRGLSVSNLLKSQMPNFGNWALGNAMPDRNMVVSFFRSMIERFSDWAY